MAPNLPTVGNIVKPDICPPFRLRSLPLVGKTSDMNNRIRELREGKGLSRNKLAGLAGTTANQLVKLENGARRLSDHWASRLASHLDVQPFELMMPAGTNADVKWIPMIGEIACGAWREAIVSATEMVPSSHGGKNSFALRPIGDSMNELLDESGFVVVDPDQTDLIDGKVYAVMNGDGETTAKRYRAVPPRLMPCSTNPAHQPIIIGQEDFRVIGRCVEVMSPL